MKILLFDIGGTHMRVGISHDGKKVGEYKMADTPKDFDKGMELFQKLAGQIFGQDKPDRISGCIAGVFNEDRASIFCSPNLSGWEGKPLRSRLEEIYGVEVSLENDANAAGLAEALFGAGKGFNNVMYVTVSTGLGAARIVDGAIDRGVFNFSIGQQIVDFEKGISLEDAVIRGDLLQNLVRGLHNRNPALVA